MEILRYETPRITAPSRFRFDDNDEASACRQNSSRTKNGFCPVRLARDAAPIPGAIAGIIHVFNSVYQWLSSMTIFLASYRRH